MDLGLTGVTASSISSLNRSGNAPLRAPAQVPTGAIPAYHSHFINRRHGQRPACGSSFDCLAADAATPTFPATRRADRRKIERAFEFSLQQFQDNVGAECFGRMERIWPTS